MSFCRRCGVELPKNSIHLYRDWPGRKEAVERVFPNATVTFCESPPCPSFFEKEIEA